jgi:probable HAF family extracellular repeat protein
MRLDCVASSACCALACCGLALAQPTYDVLDVGDLANGVGTSDPRGINNAGQVIGTASPSSGPARGFRWEPATGVKNLLSALPGQTNANAVVVDPYFIANDGTVLGGAPVYNGASFVNYHAAKWTSPTAAFEVFNSGTQRSNANAMNALGDIAGYENIPPGFSRPRLWLADGSTVNIPILPSETIGIAQRITDDGRALVYVSQSAPPYLKAFVRKPDGTRVDIPFIAGTEQFTPADMNNLGQVVGVVRQSNLSKAIIWDEAGGTRFLPLGTMTESGAMGINDAGAIVGWVKGPGFAFLTAAIWYTPTSTPVILSQRLTPTSSTWGIVGGDSISDINESGWILVTGLTPPKPGRYQHAAVLAPAYPCPVFSDHPDNVRFNYNSTIIYLGAAASSNQVITYSWKRNGQTVNDGLYGNTRVLGATTNALRIQNPTPAWAGEWICEATNATWTTPTSAPSRSRMTCWIASIRACPRAAAPT